MIVVNLIVFLILLFFIYLVIFLTMHYNLNKSLTIPSIVIFTILLLVVNYYMPLNESPPESYLMPSYDFKNQSGYSGKNLFEVTPAKKCCLFPNTSECKQIPREEINAVCCSGCTNDASTEGIPSKTYSGRPVHFEYTPESDSEWKWKRCDEVDDNPSLQPKVL